MTILIIHNYLGHYFSPCLALGFQKYPLKTLIDIFIQTLNFQETFALRICIWKISVWCMMSCWYFTQERGNSLQVVQRGVTPFGMKKKLLPFVFKLTLLVLDVLFIIHVSSFQCMLYFLSICIKCTSWKHCCEVSCSFLCWTHFV